MMTTDGPPIVVFAASPDRYKKWLDRHGCKPGHYVYASGRDKIERLPEPSFVLLPGWEDHPEACDLAEVIERWEQAQAARRASGLPPFIGGQA